MSVPDKEKEIIRRWFPILLKEDTAFREEVMAQFTGVLATKDDIAKILTTLSEHSTILAQHSRKLEEHSKILQELSKELQEHTKILQEHTKILQEHSKILQEHSKILQEHSKRIATLGRTIDAVGARWGILAEEAFRAGISGIIEDLGYKVSKWRVKDEHGKVYGKATMVEADVLIKDGRHCLIEIKSSISEFDVVGFKRVGELYKDTKEIEPRLIIISPFISQKAMKLADEFGMEYYQGSEEAFGTN